MKMVLPPGSVMIDLQGTRLIASETVRIKHPNTGGVILFSRNFESAEQVSRLIDEIRDAREGELLIAVDQEGGRVQRFREGFTRLPAAAAYAPCQGTETGKAVEAAETAGWLMASELLSVGVDFSFAPVLDVDCGISRIIGDRAFSRDARTVSVLAAAFRRGMNRAGMAAVGKHFPGHGGVAPDSHLTLPVDSRGFEEIAEKDLLPFRALIEEGLEGVMTAHVVYSAVDDQPAGFSPYWIKQILRGQLGFDGAVFSDDLSMEGAACAGDYAERARLSLAAGCDMVLVCNRPAEAEKVLASLPIEEDSQRLRRLLAMRARHGVNRRQLLGSDEWREAGDKLWRIGA